MNTQYEPSDKKLLRLHLNGCPYGDKYTAELLEYVGENKDKIRIRWCDTGMEEVVYRFIFDK